MQTPVPPLPPAETDGAPVPRADRRRACVCAALAAIASLGVVIWALGDLSIGPTTHLLGLTGNSPRAVLARSDQAMVLGTVVRNARVLLRNPSDLRGTGACYPVPRSYTLGEHMFGSGLLAALPFAITGDPIASYNAMLALTLWIPALAMYALAFHFTRDAAGSFVAGLLFAIWRERVMDVAHPFVHGDLWIPLVLLFLHRTFVRPRWTNALALACFAILSLGESLYPLLSASVLASVYGIALLVRHRRDLARRIAALGFAVALVSGAAVFVFAPYLETAAVWGVLQGRVSFFTTARMWSPGNVSFPGWVLLGLAAVALVDRARRRRTCEHGEDPRLAIALGGFLVWWCSLYALPLPGIALPSPLVLARSVLPGLESVRGLGNVGLGVILSLSFLAAYAVRALAGRRVVARLGLATAAALALLVEQFHPAVTTWSFGTPYDLVPYRAAPSPEDVALFARAGDGAVLDVPMMDRANFLRSAHPLLVSAYHGRPTSACYNSFGTPVIDQVFELAQSVLRPTTLDALAGLGFGTIVVHRDQLLEKQADWLLMKLAELAARGGRLEEIGRSEDHVVYRLKPLRAAARFRALASDRVAPGHRVDAGAEAEIPFVFRNDGANVFRHPDPIAPSDVVLRWHRSKEEPPKESRGRVLLPLALGRGDQATIAVTTTVPAPPGLYVVELVRAQEPNLVLTRRVIEVVPSGTT
jgi:hypothetical protein